MTAKADRLVKPLGDEVFNPLDKTHLAESVSDRLLNPKKSESSGFRASPTTSVTARATAADPKDASRGGDDAGALMAGQHGDCRRWTYPRRRCFTAQFKMTYYPLTVKKTWHNPNSSYNSNLILTGPSALSRIHTETKTASAVSVQGVGVS
jgi:hypothetical protein